MGEIATKLLEVLKSPRLSAVGMLISGIILWFPRRFLPAGANIPDKYQVWVFLLFVACVAGLLVSSIAKAWEASSKSRTTKRFHAKILEELNHLTPDEKYILAYYIVRKTVTQYLEMDNGVVGALMGKGLLVMGSRMGRFNQFAVNINSNVYKHLEKHPELLEGAAPPEDTPFERMRFR